MLLSLPYEILLIILQYVEVKGIIALQRTCKSLHEIICDDNIWKYLCKRDYNVDHLSAHVASFYKIYSCLLYKHGHLIGLYRSGIYAFGGLFEVVYENCAICGYSQEAQNIRHPLNKVLVFKVTLDNKQLCFHSNEEHECSITFNEETSQITQTCQHVDSLEMIHQFTALRNPFLNKMIFYFDSLRNGLVYKPVVLPKETDVPAELLLKNGCIPKQIFPPGLFVSIYGGHGPEIVLFKYKNKYEIIGEKVSGDLNVFAGQITVKINLKFPVRPTLSEQRDLNWLRSFQPCSSNEPLTSLQPQPFVPPHGTTGDYDMMPDTCLARYSGYGQVAYVRFQNPTFIPVHVMIFDCDTLAVLFIELSVCRLFTRIKENFSNIHRH